MTQRASAGRFQPILQSPAIPHLRETNTTLILEDAKTCREKPSSSSSPKGGVINRSASTFTPGKYRIYHTCAHSATFSQALAQLNLSSGFTPARYNYTKAFQGPEPGVCQQREPSHCWLGCWGTQQSFSAAPSVISPSFGWRGTHLGTPMYSETVQSAFCCKYSALLQYARANK